MQRQPEALELMDDSEQASAYAAADFSEPHNRFIELFRENFLQEKVHGTVLDLGCGPADICIRFAQAFPECLIEGIDGAPTMLALGEKRIHREKLQHRIALQHCYLPDKRIKKTYATLISNSLLHHLLDPMVLWETVRQMAAPCSRVFIMDLMRPASSLDAKALVAGYASGEPEILQHDFYRSLLAAYTPVEVEQQLLQAGLSCLKVFAVSDHHLVIAGRMPSS